MAHKCKMSLCASRGFSFACVVVSVALAGCAQNAESLAPSSPSQPWTPGNTTGSSLLPRSDASQGAGASVRDFSVLGNAAVAELPPPPQTQAGKVYQLPELIDIAARNNPVTRIAWEQARQSALAVGIAEATFLPLITANAVGGVQNTDTPVQALGVQRYLNTTARGVSSSVALQWLMFDFGQRSAVVDAARQVSLAANVMFNASHQKLIFDVTRTYYQYGAARTRMEIADQTLRNSRAILDAAVQREKGGLGTTVEVAQARQQVAQSELRRVVAEGQERDAYQALLAAMGVSPTLSIKVASAGNRRLPSPVSMPMEDMIKLALVRRPDVLASYATIKASEAGVEAAKADVLPKVFVAGGLATGSGSFNASGLPTIGQQTSATGVLVGATMPLYDAGVRSANLRAAQSRVSAAHDIFKKTQQEAVREMVVASNAVRSALQSYQAATRLTEAATITYDAALDAYRNGLGTITAATAADTGLLDARQARADAHAAALVAASNLAFVLGAMTSRDTPDQLLLR
ncbi:outer membrane protein TolC [Chelatococcus asaccharovorans]|uniref:Protein CyaE n=2 Tax=Chelatococcus asaccharovorans TaxID=28210 RepID=A0A2V3UCQ3_9HYPH|nr:outer membrane protein TolC [Chelatococcus asaccharovorans]